MPDSHNHNYHPFPVDSVYDAIVADSNPKMVQLRFELLAAGWERIFTECDNFLSDAPLKLPVEVPELACGGRREFKNIAHGR